MLKKNLWLVFSLLLMDIHAFGMEEGQPLKKQKVEPLDKDKVIDYCNLIHKILPGHIRATLHLRPRIKPAARMKQGELFDHNERIKEVMLVPSLPSAFINPQEKIKTAVQLYKKLLSSDEICVDTIKELLHKNSIDSIERYLKRNNSSLLIELAKEDVALEKKLSPNELNILLSHLITNGADMYATVKLENDSKDSVSNMLLKSCSYSILKTLLRCGMDPNVIQPCGYTLLHDAARFLDFEPVSLLLKAGANVTALDPEGRTAMHHVCFDDALELYDELENQFLKIVAHLLDAGASINAQDNEGDTPLHTLIETYQERAISNDIIETLLATGADPNIKNKRNETPIMLLTEKIDYERPQEVAALQLLLNKQR